MTHPTSLCGRKRSTPIILSLPLSFGQQKMPIAEFSFAEYSCNVGITLLQGPYKDLKNYKAQEWNRIEIVVKGNVALCTCNGELLESALKLPDTGSLGLGS